MPLRLDEAKITLTLCTLVAMLACLFTIQKVREWEQTTMISRIAFIAKDAFFASIAIFLIRISIKDKENKKYQQQ